jgi:hypothetical protein
MTLAFLSGEFELWEASVGFYGDMSTELLQFWTLSIVLSLKHNVPETGFCLPLQMVHTQLLTTDTASSCLLSRNVIATLNSKGDNFGDVGIIWHASRLLILLN